jgi:hypothetical protein
MTESDSVLEIDAAGRERRPDFWEGLWGISQFGTFENLSKGCSSQGGAVEGCGKSDERGAEFELICGTALHR